MTNSQTIWNPRLPGACSGFSAWITAAANRVQQLKTARPGGRFLVDALCPLDELVEACHLELPEVTSDTTGGLIIELLGHIPQPGEKVRVGRHELTVLDAEPTRVRRVEVQEIEPDSEQTAPREPGAESREAREPAPAPESVEPTGRPA